jgi:hypothetical protein
VAVIDFKMIDKETPAKGRVASTIAFPYSDMNDAIAVAEGVLKGGGVALSRDQLAAAMGLSPVGGGFATKVATARLFGVIETSSGKYQLSEVGHELVDPGRRAEAMTKAFLNVELYRKIYEEFRGKRLPPRPHGIEAALVSFGVTAKNARHARLALDRSARMAGFFPNSEEDRLVMPFGIGPTVAQADEAQAASFEAEPIKAMQIQREAGTAVSAGFAPGLHPSISGMLSELPAPKSEWSRAEQADWLDALQSLFRVIYKSPNDKGEIVVEYKRTVFDK